MARLVFFTGHAGAGKSTIAARAVPALHARTGESFCLLDKDTLYGAYSARVMHLLTGDAQDRDSPTYLDNLRDPEYAGLIDVARENLALGVNALVVGPFSRELRDGLLFDEWARVLASVLRQDAHALGHAGHGRLGGARRGRSQTADRKTG